MSLYKNIFTACYPCPAGGCPIWTKELGDSRDETWTAYANAGFGYHQLICVGHRKGKRGRSRKEKAEEVK